MTKIIFLSSLIIFCNFLFSEVNADPLLNKTRIIAENNWNLIPGKTIVTDSVYKKNHKLVKSSYLKWSHALNSEKKIENKIDTLIIKGKPAKKSELMNYQTHFKIDYTPDNKSMFHNNADNPPKMNKTDEIKNINNLECVCYDFEYKTKNSKDEDVKQIGKVWISTEYGAPIKMIFTLEPLHKSVLKFEAVVDYFFNPENGEWYQSKLNIKSETKIMYFIYRDIDSVTEFKNYWKYEVN